MEHIDEEVIALLNFNDKYYEFLCRCNLNGKRLVQFNNIIELCKHYEKQKDRIVAIISQSEVMGIGGAHLGVTLREKKMDHIPFFLFSENINENLRQICLHAGVAEAFTPPLNILKVEARVNFLIKHWGELHKQVGNQPIPAYKTPFIKRAFDILLAGIAIICLLPVLLLVMLIMRLESKGPIFYYSLRAGTGYRVFRFYKFRSMYVNADQKLKELKHLNQYDSEEAKHEPVITDGLCEECRASGTNACRHPMYADEHTWCERQYMNIRRKKNGAAFVKFKNDPRVTKIGNILRNTSIDELPQLWNVIKGDMSIVGNRPLPLYEAEKLTTDKHVMRFLAPAGLTGLWQVEKRGKGKMSEEERLMLDNTYAKNSSFLFDIKLILRTIPALFQKENV